MPTIHIGVTDAQFAHLYKIAEGENAAKKPGDGQTTVHDVAKMILQKWFEQEM